MLRVYSKCLSTVTGIRSNTLFTSRSVATAAAGNNSSSTYQKQDVATKPQEQHPLTTDRKFGPKTMRTYHLRTKKPMRPPLVKNFFSGKVDTDLLTYPEVIPRDDMITLYKNVDDTVQYFRNNINSKEILDRQHISGTIIGDMSELEMFGVDISHEYGGRSYGYTEMSLTSEAECKDINVATTLNAHRQAARIISTFGTEVQKSKYLPRLAKGELIGTIGFYETDHPSEGVFSTTATNIDDDWILNGEKSFVTNAENANLFVVFVQTCSPDKLGDKKNTVSVFIVEKSTAGVSIGERESTIGCSGVQQSPILLTNVTLNLDNMISSIGNGTEVAQVFLRQSRLQSSIVCLSLMKNIINQLTQFGIHTQQFGIKLMDMELLKEKLSKVMCAAYVLESMIYLTAGIHDDYESADIDVETAIIRIFAQQQLFDAATIALDFMGPKSLIAGQPTELYLKDALQLYTHGEPIDSLFLIVALSGIQHAGHSIHELVKKVRNPLLNPSFIFKRLFESQNIDQPKSTLNLNHYLHPSLDPAAQWLEHSICRLHASTETLLSRYGVEIMDRQVEMLRISECAMLSFGMFASIARSSRAYCIGLQHSDFEMLMSSAFAYDAMSAIKRRAVAIREGPYITNDMNHQKVAKQLFKSNGYFAVHPLTRNF